MKEDNGNYLSWNNDNWDDDSYETPPETINSESESEDDDNPNAPENSNNEFENDSEHEEMLNNPANDTAMELCKMLNFPDLLDVTKKNQESSSAKDEQIQGEYNQPSYNRHRRTRSHSPTSYSGSRWLYYPL